MANGADLEEVRRLYAREVLDAAGVEDVRIEEAFATIPRENFLPRGPWTLIERGLVDRTPDADPAHLYRNVLVALDRAKGINNGEPALHAAWLKAVDPRPGETALHVGAGGGYYTAMLARLVAPGGRVEAYEVDENLAADAARNLEGHPEVTVHVGSALGQALPPADIIYVNAAMAAPDTGLLKALRPGGRLILPWQALSDWGHALSIVRRPGGFEARAGMGVGFIRCVGEASLVPKGRLRDADILATRSVWLAAEHEPNETATAVFPAVWFSSREVGEATL